MKRNSEEFSLVGTERQGIWQTVYKLGGVPHA